MFVPPVAVALLAFVPPSATAANRKRRTKVWKGQGGRIRGRVKGREGRQYGDKREGEGGKERQEDQWVKERKGEVKWRGDRRLRNMAVRGSMVPN